jgi:hypothetical protein
MMIVIGLCEVKSYRVKEKKHERTKETMTNTAYRQRQLSPMFHSSLSSLSPPTPSVMYLHSLLQQLEPPVPPTVPNLTACCVADVPDLLDYETNPVEIAVVGLRLRYPYSFQPVLGLPSVVVATAVEAVVDEQGEPVAASP